MAGTDDDGLVNTKLGLFLGVVTVNRAHALLQAVFGAVGLEASRMSDALAGT